MNIEYKTMFCVAKSVHLRNTLGAVIHTIPFGSRFRVMIDLGDGRYYGEAMVAYRTKNTCGYKRYRGFVPAAGFAENAVVDMAGLRYRNIAGRKVPVSMRYRGKPCGTLEPNQSVCVYAVAGNWMLTEKGWTKTSWMQKIREIDDYESMKSLVYAVITQTVKDYQRIIRRLQAGNRFVPGEYQNTTAEMRLIRDWFTEGNYLKIIEDDMSGAERLQMLDNELGVTEQWVNTVMSRKKAR